jgi:hypothetical protein
MENQYFDQSEKKTISFYFALVLTFILFLLMLNTDLAHYSQHENTRVPFWFVNLLIGLDIVIVLSLVFIYFYKKIGVFLFPISVFIHHLLYEFYLSTTLLAGLHLLFVFLTAGLLVIIPRWKFFK